MSITFLFSPSRSFPAPSSPQASLVHNTRTRVIWLARPLEEPRLRSGEEDVGIAFSGSEGPTSLDGYVLSSRAISFPECSNCKEPVSPGQNASSQVHAQRGCYTVSTLSPRPVPAVRCGCQGARIEVRCLSIMRGGGYSQVHQAGLGGSDVSPEARNSCARRLFWQTGRQASARSVNITRNSRPRSWLEIPYLRGEKHRVSSASLLLVSWNHIRSFLHRIPNIQYPIQSISNLISNIHLPAVPRFCYLVRMQLWASRRSSPGKQYNIAE